MKKNTQRFLVKCFASFIILYQCSFPLALSFVYAQEVDQNQPISSPEPTVTPTATPNPTSEPTPSNTPEPSPSPTSDPAETILNTDQSTPTPSPTTTIVCPGIDLSLCAGNAINNASTSANLDVSAQSGDNIATGADNTDMLTGNSQAIGQQTVAVNNTSNNGGENSNSSSGNNQNNEGSSDSSLTNTAVTDVTAIVSAQSGSNIITSNNSGNLETGHSYAIADILAVINSFFSNSGINFLSLNLTDPSSNIIDLNSLWKTLLGSQPTFAEALPYPNAATSSAILSNTAYLQALVSAYASTGNNIVTGDTTSIQTGNASALATATNIVNTQISNSTVFIGNINLLATQSGNLLLPRPELFNQQSGMVFYVTNNGLFIQNRADITSQVNAFANTGNNTQGGISTTMQTGNALALANNYLFTNMFLSGQDIFLLVINNGSNWQGQVIDWPFSLESNIQQLTGQTIIATDNPLVYGEPTAILQTNNTTHISNQAHINTQVLASATTGDNYTDSWQSYMKTGNATAIANAFSLINSTITKSRMFIGFVNILNTWTGNVVFAYPDLAVSINTSTQNVQPGQTISYTLNCFNQGDDMAQETRLTFNLPPQFHFSSASDSNFNKISENQFVWHLGNLDKQKGQSITVNVIVDSNFSFDQNTATLPFVKVAYATDKHKERPVTVSAWAQSNDPETNTSNNGYSIESVVFQGSSNNQSGTDSRLPKIQVEASNNVNTFVYPGDTVSFTAKISNLSDVVATDSYAINTLYDNNGNPIYSARFDLGTIDPSFTGTLSFGITIPKNSITSESSFNTGIVIYGKSPDGTQVSSNQANTSFLVKPVMAFGSSNFGVASKLAPKKAVTIPRVLAASTSSLNDSWLSKWQLAVIPMVAGLLVIAFVIKRVRYLVKSV